ncbi:MAG: tetratricopeptide repeat protein [Roseivirga sp.]|nr:tetratricopeptide repeat protein [Roseivirga sp.]
MNLEEDYLIERFLKGELSPEEEEAFRARMASDSVFLEKVTLERQLFDTFNEEDWSFAENDEAAEVKEYADLFGHDSSKAVSEAIASSQSMYKAGQEKRHIRPWYVYASAALLLILLSFYFLFPRDTTPALLYTSYLEQTELPSLIRRGDTVTDTELAKGQAYFENQQFEEAARVFSGLLQKDDDNGAFYIYLAISHAELSASDQALNVLNQLIQSDLLDSEKGYWYKSLVYLKSDQVEESQRLLERIIEHRYYNYGLAQMLAKELE